MNQMVYLANAKILAKKMIFLIVAVSNNNVIGLNNKLPFEIPLYSKWFKMNTYGGTVIMGRKTFESCGLLPGCRNIIISRRCAKPKNIKAGWYNHLDVAMKSIPKNEDAYIIGGAELYITALHYVEAMIVTRVQKNVKGDTFFKIPNGKLVCSSQKNGHRFEIYRRTF
jgi:dihydrofolate reductase